ncbi:MAG: tRNA (adenosine(37)-N6)-threonylcarbamoyltransferase complex transferase subunit TsaD [Bdellovibrionales bacterium]
MPIALGIETSCDDTSVSLVTHEAEVLFLKRQTQDETHKKYGGIVPELASRNHLHLLLPLIQEALKVVPEKNVDLIAVTNRPGLLGSLLVGCITAKTLSMVWKKPIMGVNHIESHIFSSYLWNQKSLRKNQDLVFPALSLVVSGGHSSLFYVRDVGDSILLGSTLDDAAGEALDKFAKLLGFSWPGGPHIDSWSQKSRSLESNFFSKIQTKNLDFSFSGIKSAGYRFLSKKSKDWISKNLPEICFSYQEIIVDHLIDKLEKAFQKYPTKRILIGGGVSANTRLKVQIEKWAKSRSLECFYPEKNYCTDNAAMVAFTGLQYFLKRKTAFPIDVPCTPHHLEKDFFSVNANYES